MAPAPAGTRPPPGQPPFCRPATAQRPNGTISPLHFTLLWPYHLGLRGKLALQRMISTEPSFSQASTAEQASPCWGSSREAALRVLAI